MDKIAKSSQGGYIYLLKYMHVCVFLYIYLCVIYFYKCIHTERGEREGKKWSWFLNANKQIDAFSYGNQDFSVALQNLLLRS